MANKYFHESNRKTKYGEHDVKFWIGTVVSYAAQKEQIEKGFGWMYKVRVDGDHAVGADSIKDEQLDYAYCILPTTAGSGGAYKLRSARISQGDTVFGVRGGGKSAPHFIIGVFPRTRLTKNSSGNFGMLSGFWENGTLSDTGILSGQFNDQVGPEFLKGLSGLDPKKWTKATATNPSEKVKEIVPSVKKEKNIATGGTGGTDDTTDDTIEEFKEITEEETEKNDVKNNAGKVVDPKEWKPGTPLNTPTMEALKESFDKGELPPATWEAALKQASEQGLDGYEEYVIKKEIKEEVQPKKAEYKKEELKKVNDKSQVIQILSKKYPYVDTSGLKTYADYIAEGVVIEELGKGTNDFVFKYPDGRRVTSYSSGGSNVSTLEGRFNNLIFVKQKEKQDEIIAEQKREEEKRKREAEQLERNKYWATKFPDLYHPDGRRK